MAYYRLYSLELEHFHFIDVSSFVAESDLAAIRKVRRGGPGEARELWNLGRKVMDFPPRPTIAPDNEEPNRFENLIGPGGRWKWNPLQGHCQAVA